MRTICSLFAIILQFSLFAGFAPESLEGEQIRYVLDTTSGEFADYRGHIFETSFQKHSIYKDVDSSTGMLHDGGNYHYFRTSDDTAELHYHITSTGAWKDMHLIEKLYFSSPNHGRVIGEHAGDFVCGYSGSFTVHPADDTP